VILAAVKLLYFGRQRTAKCHVQFLNTAADGE
jgi:hypothetical protein